MANRVQGWWVLSCVLGVALAGCSQAGSGDDDGKQTFQPPPCEANFTDGTAAPLTLGERTDLSLCGVDGGVTYIWRVAGPVLAGQEYRLTMQAALADGGVAPPFQAQLRTAAGPLGGPCGPAVDGGACEGRLDADAPTLFADVGTRGPVPVGTALSLTPTLLRDIPVCSGDNTAFPQASVVTSRVAGTVCAGNTWWWRADGLGGSTTHVQVTMKSGPWADRLVFRVQPGTLAGPSMAVPADECPTNAQGVADCTFPRSTGGTATFVSVTPPAGVAEELFVAINP